MDFFYKLKLTGRQIFSLDLVRGGIRVLRDEGLSNFITKSVRHLINIILLKHSIEYEYPIWIKQNLLSDEEIEKIKSSLYCCPLRPLISVLMPVYNVESRWLDKAIGSVVDQYYDNWELCIIDDCSTNPEVRETLEKWRKKDPRIHIKYLPQNLHISGASNEALKIARGEFIALLDNDDELAPEALYENVKLLNEHPDADMIYSDEDKISTTGRRSGPCFKPGWSPDLFLSQMYTCHLGVYRKSVVEKIGGFREGFEGAQDWDLVLRLTEITQNIHHIPNILYHWRMINTSTAFSYKTKSYAYESAAKALTEALERRGISGQIEQESWAGSFRLKRDIIGSPKVSIIIPIRDSVDLLKKCIEGIIEKAGHKNFEIIIIDNNSEKQKNLDYLDKLQQNSAIKVARYHKEFNFSAINNFGVSLATGEHILFMNNNIDAISDGWLAAMLEHSQRPEVGAVGCKLMYPNGTIQHAGVILGINGTAGHAHKLLSKNCYGYCGYPHVIRNYSAVTAACMMMKKKDFLDIGGFDEDEFGLAFNDVDLCLRLREKGLLIVYTPYAVLRHYESASRGWDMDQVELKNFQRKWGRVQQNDPYYNPNLTSKTEDFSLNLST